MLIEQSATLDSSLKNNPLPTTHAEYIKLYISIDDILIHSSNFIIPMISGFYIIHKFRLFTGCVYCVWMTLFKEIIVFNFCLLFLLIFVIQDRLLIS